MMNVKQIGNWAEKLLQEKLAGYGFWAHILQDDSRGQPFDIIAIKNGIPFAIDSKTSISNRFNYEQRIEKNQLSAFEILKKQGIKVGFAILYEGIFYFLDYEKIDINKKSCVINKLPNLERYLIECLLH